MVLPFWSIRVNVNAELVKLTILDMVVVRGAENPVVGTRFWLEHCRQIKGTFLVQILLSLWG